MPLRKRFEKELLPEWRTHCIDYKGLKRQAESLVGAECAAGAQARFLGKLGCEMDKASQLYLNQERRLLRFYLTLTLKWEEACRIIKKVYTPPPSGSPILTRSRPNPHLHTSFARHASQEHALHKAPEKLRTPPPTVARCVRLFDPFSLPCRFAARRMLPRGGAQSVPPGVLRLGAAAEVCVGPPRPPCAH
mmetsp:Transcript_58182/g.140264  ORF Transcript_58182/g.140264 Transcript_58182/m.140264 type:complete len:191 (+) Transcript_58182:197-769(+)